MFNLLLLFRMLSMLMAVAVATAVDLVVVIDDAIAADFML